MTQVARRRRGSREPSWEALPTEAMHPEAAALDRMSASRILELMNREDEHVLEAVRGEATRIARASKAMAAALAAGGRAFFVGAGTSGRLGVLEAAECPPTFGTDPDQIVAVMAGGRSSVFRSKEGAEDRADRGSESMTEHAVDRRDCVVGISASSVTPFVKGALDTAGRRGAATALVTCGPRLRGVADVVIAPRVGAEVLAGSTRMKAGTATKIVLNQLTLLAMVRLHKVYGPYMVDVKPSSAKLRDRAARIVSEIAGVDRSAARSFLDAASGEVKTALVMERLDCSAREARRELARVAGNLRRVATRRASRER